jgi:hypothetical protein
MESWGVAKLEQMIRDGVEESLSLEFKAAGALARSDHAKREITKDVSAMANADGGTIIYGISEFHDQGRRHLPERVDPIDQAAFSKEWLESIFENIRPRIEGLQVIPLRFGFPTPGSVYVVVVPQSHTAHQAVDRRYYKRHNFESVPMHDYEVRDVMSRGTLPLLQLSCVIRKTSQRAYTGGPESPRRADLHVTARNIGKVYAMYVNAFVYVPKALSIEYLVARKSEDIDGTEYLRHYEDNTVRDVVDYRSNIPYGSIPKYGPSRYDPILPGRSTRWEIDIKPPPFSPEISRLSILWRVHADNAPERTGRVLIQDIRVEEET